MSRTAKWSGESHRLKSVQTRTLEREVVLRSRLKELRLRAAVIQNYQCFYCAGPMWVSDPIGFAAKYSLSARQARLLQCTAEHLKPRCEGGSNVSCNVVAACLLCNSRRHRSLRPLDPQSFRKRVQWARLKGRWHTFVVPGAEQCRTVAAPRMAGFRNSCDHAE